MDSPRLTWRAPALYGALLLGLLLAALALLWPAWIHRAALLAQAEALSETTGVIPAPRGAIYDAVGVRLAWSEKYFDLFYLGSDPEADQVVLTELSRRIPGVTPPGRLDPLPWRLRSELTPEEFDAIQSYIARHPEARVLTRTVRHHHPDPALARYLGEVALDGDTGMVSGVDGIEAEFDAVLSGVPGEYAVNLDRHGQWVVSSWRLLTPVIPGRDVRLESGWAEWLRLQEGYDDAESAK